MGAQTTVARSIAGVYNIYPPCYATLCYAVLRSSYTTNRLALPYHSTVALAMKSATFWVLRYLCKVGGDK